MLFKVPIVTTDISFIREVCKDAALYYDPLNPHSAAEKILEIVSNKCLSKKLIEAGERILLNHPNSFDRNKKVLDFLSKKITALR